MRKLSLIAANIFIAATVLFTSCKTDDEVSGPNISFFASDDDGDYVTSSADVAPGGSFQVKLNVEKGDKDMDILAVTLDKGLAIPASGISFSDLESSDIVGPLVTLKGSDQKDFNTIITITAPEATGVLTYSFTVTDKDDVVTTKTITINVAVPAEVTEYTAKLLGAQSASAGSYFASSTGMVYTGGQFEANKSIIDITYAQTGPAGSVTDKIISSAARSGEELNAGIGGLAVYYSSSSLTYDDVTVSDIEGLEKSTSQVITIEEGKTYEFVTENGSKGVFYVNSISNPGSSLPADPQPSDFKGSIDISVKTLK